MRFVIKKTDRIKPKGAACMSSFLLSKIEDRFSPILQQQHGFPLGDPRLAPVLLQLPAGQTHTSATSSPPSAFCLLVLSSWGTDFRAKV